MAGTRKIVIEFDATVGGYTAKTEEMIRQNQRLNKSAIDGGQQTFDAYQKTKGGVDNLATAHEKLAKGSGPLRAGLASIVEQLGLTGPAAHLAGHAVLELNDGLSRMTAATLAAGLGVGAMITTLKAASEEKTKFNEASRRAT
jgi:hypothetical protein